MSSTTTGSGATSLAKQQQQQQQRRSQAPVPPPPGSQQGGRGLLRAVSKARVAEWTSQRGFRDGSFMLLLSVLLAVAWYSNVERSRLCRKGATHLVGYFWDGESLHEVAGSLLVLVKDLLRASALALGVVGTLSVAGATYQTVATPPRVLEGLTDEQRRLLGLESFASLDAAARRQGDVPALGGRGSGPAGGPASSVNGTLPPTTGSISSSSSTGNNPAAVRSPWGNDVGPPYMSPPASSLLLRDRFTPGSSGGSGGRPPRRRGSRNGSGMGAATLSFGGTADEKIHDLLEDWRQEDLLLASPAGGGAAALAAGGGTPGPGEPGSYVNLAAISPSTGRVERYKESPVGGQGGLLAGKSGSPSERWDAAEWARTLQRLGLDSYKVSQYVDNLRGALYNEMDALLVRFTEQVRLLGNLGVPGELMLDLQSVSPTGHTLEDYLGQARMQDARLVHEFGCTKRIMKEGFNWKDLFGYVSRRLEELVEDSYLSGYDWSRGGTLRDKNVSVELPTDADIVMHMFLWRCDSLSEHRLSEGDQPFIKQHFLQVMPGEESRSLRGRNLIVRHGSSPPYFSVVENGVVYRIPRGKDNAFIAIVLFLYFARRDKWLPTYNHGYKRLLEAVFGSALHPKGSKSGGGVGGPLRTGGGGVGGSGGRR